MRLFGDVHARFMPAGGLTAEQSSTREADAAWSLRSPPRILREAALPLGEGAVLMAPNRIFPRMAARCRRSDNFLIYGYA